MYFYFIFVSVVSGIILLGFLLSFYVWIWNNLPFNSSIYSRGLVRKRGSALRSAVTMRRRVRDHGTLNNTTMSVFLCEDCRAVEVILKYLTERLTQR